MRPDVERTIVAHLATGDLNASRIARMTGIPRSTVRDWLSGPRRKRAERRRSRAPSIASLPGAQYSYLLGFYLGDGTISRQRRGMYRLRITTDCRYPGVIAECVATMRAVMPQNRVNVQRRKYQAVEIGCSSKAWPLLFPQHGPGPKHTRKIELAPWQTHIVDRYPGEFLRGLIHSDGCRVLNRVNGKPYPRYLFDQVSDDIRRLFCEVCSKLGIRYTWSRWKTVSIARAESVALLDSFVGPKV
jgi:hypothetical protein